VLLGNKSYLAALYITSPLIEQVKQWQKEEPKTMKIKKGVEERIKEFLI